MAQNNVLIKRDSREIYEVLAARMRKLITACARKNKCTAHMLPNGCKDHSIPLFVKLELVLHVTKAAKRVNQRFNFLPSFNLAFLISNIAKQVNKYILS